MSDVSITINDNGLSAHLTFDRKFTYAYGDSWIIEWTKP